jgi:hypothetical protein
MTVFNNVAGKYYSVSNKAEKVDGYNYTFSCWVRMHFSYFHLLVNQVKEMFTMLVAWVYSIV